MAELQAGERRVRTRLVIGADGAQSRVRELAGLSATRTDYGQTAIVAMVATERSHEHTAWQRFLGDGTLAFLPLKGSHGSIVWSIPTARAETMLAASPAIFERELERDFDGALGKVQLVSDRLKFPLWRLSAEAYVTSRVALVGDAAHVVHPLAGQGANLGLLDAATLADVDFLLPIQHRGPSHGVGAAAAAFAVAWEAASIRPDAIGRVRLALAVGAA